MAGREGAGRGLGPYDIERRYDGDGRAGFDEPRNPRSWNGRMGGRGDFYGGRRSNSDILCYACNKRGHTQSAGPEKPGSSPVRCHGCMQLGHFMRDCPNGLPVGRFPAPPAERAPVLRDERDFGFRERDFAIPPGGHLNGTAFDGPPGRWHRPGEEYAWEHFEMSDAGPPFRGPVKAGGCFGCGQPGHRQRECPNMLGKRGEPPPDRGHRPGEDQSRSPPRRTGFSAGPGRRWMYEDLDGEKRGPYNLDQMRAWLRNGHFKIDQLVCLEGSQEMTTLGRALGLPLGRDINPPRPVQDGAFQRRDPPNSRSAERPPPPRESRFDRAAFNAPVEPSAPGFPPVEPAFLPPLPAVQRPRLHIPDIPPPQAPKHSLSGTPPLSSTPPVAATPSIVSSLSPTPRSSVSPHVQRFAFPTPPSENTLPAPSQPRVPLDSPSLPRNPPSEAQHPGSDPKAEQHAANGEAWGNGSLISEEEALTPHIQWENGYDGCSSLSGSEPGSPLHMSPRAALGQELLDKLGSPERSITGRVDQILLDTEMDEGTSVEQRMHIVIGILGRRLLDRESKEAKDMRSFAYGSQAEAEAEVPTVSAWKHGYGFGEMAAAEAREASAAPQNEYNLDPDFFFHAYGPGNTGKGGQQFYYDEEAAGRELEKDSGGVVYELDREREKQDPAKWLLRGGDWKLEHDPQLRIEDDTGNPPPLCKYVLNRGLPLCGDEAPKIDPEGGEQPRDPRMGGTHRVAMQEAVRADFSRLEVPLFRQKGIPSGLQKDTGKARPSRPVPDSPTMSIRSPTENIRPPVPSKKILKRPASLAKKLGGLKKAASTSDVVKGDASAAPPVGTGHDPQLLAKSKEDASEKKGARGSDSPAAWTLANGLVRKSPKLGTTKVPTPKGSPAEAPKKSKPTKWDEGLPEKERGEAPEMRPSERIRKKVPLAQAVQAAKRAHLGPEEGQWFYMDGQGVPKGPFPLPQLRVMAAQGKIVEGISAWRMSDDTWVPVTKPKEPRFGPPPGAFPPSPLPPGFAAPWSRPRLMGVPPWQPPWAGGVSAPMQSPLQPPLPPGLPPGMPLPFSRGTLADGPGLGWGGPNREASRGGEARSMPPELLAMVRGKLHEQVVKTARTKVLDAAIDSALSAWLQTRLGGAIADETAEPEGVAKRLVEKEKVEVSGADAGPVREEGGGQAAAEAPHEGGVPSVDVSGPGEPSSNEAEDLEMSKSVEKFLKSRRSIAYIFLDACKSPRGGMDMALLARYACVCRGFRKGAELAKLRMFRADFSVLGERCTDAALKSLETCGEGLVKFVYLNGCTNVTPEAVEDLLRAQPSIRCIDIQGCVQVYSLARSCPQIKWRNLPEALVEVPGGANALPPDLLEDQQKRREKFAKARQLRGIERILDEIRKLDEAKIFLVLVSEEQYPNYSKVIQRPIALVTMRQRLKGRYLPLGKGVDRFREDMELMFDNAKRFNREGTFYYKEAVRLQKVADKLLDHLEARVKGTLDGTVPVRKASLQRGERASVLQRPAELDLPVQSRLMKPSMPGKTPRGLGESDALPSISASSVEESYRAGAEEGFREGEAGRKRKERGEEREESESGKRRREDSDAESNRLRGKRPREEDDLDEYRAFERRRVDSARRLDTEGKRPISAPLQWERDEKRKRSKLHRPEFPRWTDFPRMDSRGGSSQDVGRGAGEADVPAKRAAARRRQRIMDDSESDSAEWASEDTEEEPDSGGESLGDATESEEEDDMDEDEEPENHINWVMEDDLADRTNWGAKMTKATMVPPVSRKYELIDEYRIVSDTAMVESKMVAHLPECTLNSLTLREGPAGSVNHLDAPVVHAKKPRKKLGEEVLEQEVYGIDPYTHNLLLDTMAKNVKGYMKDEEKRDFIEQPLLMALNRAASAYTGYAKVPESLDLKVVVQVVRKEAEEVGNKALAAFAQALYENMEKRPLDKYLAYRKGLGVVCNRAAGIQKEDFVVEFHGEVYPPYRWFEKEDEIRRLQKKEVAPEFYNIMLERPKMDLGGYDLLVVDAMHKANFASRLCHSCTPNCATKVTAVEGKYMIGVYAIEDIREGEELTFNYHSVTESKEEHEHAVCLCGSRQCQGSYLNFAGSTSFQQVMNKIHGVLDRHHLLLRACQDPTLDAHDRANLERAGFRSSLLEGLPPWAIKYAAQVVHFVFQERALLPQELLDHTKKHKRRKAVDNDLCKQAAQDEAEGVESQRLQNLAITLDKVRHCLTALCRCPATEAPPPLRLLSPSEVVSRMWTGEDSIVQQIRRFLMLHVDDLARLEPILAEIQRRQPEETEEGLIAMRASLLWLRDTLIGLDIKPTARHDAAADLLSMYAHTKDFFTHAEYVGASFESEPVTIVAMDLGVKESSFPPKTVRKSYKPYFVWGQLINWYKQSVADPGATLNNVRRGCLTLPDPGSCYSATAKQAIPRGYGRKQRARMLDKYIANKVQGPWPKQEQHWLWSHNIRGLYGSPWFDAIRAGQPVEPDLVRWLRTRPVFEGPYDHGR